MSTDHHRILTANHSRPLPPFSSLPPEIISEIMVSRWEDSCPPNRVYDPPSDDPALPQLNISTFHSLPAVLMSHVCHKWRSIALSNRRLWSSIFLDENSLSRNVHRYHSYLRLFLSRSGSHPLMIRIGGKASYTFEKHFLSVLLKHAERWKHLDCPPSLLDLQGFRSSSFPILSTLYVDSGPHNTTDHIRPRFPHTPSLRRVSVNHQEFISLLALPWGQLTSFSGAIDKWHADTDSISHLTRVTELTLQFFIPLSAIIFLPEVRTAKLLFTCSGETMCHVLNSLSFPKLESLTIHGGWFNSLPPNLFEVFSSFLGRTESVLQIAKLSFLDFPLSTSELIETFSIVPGLTFLKTANGNAELFEYLTPAYPSLSGSALPHLRHLEVGGCFSEDDVDTLLALVRSRMPPKGSLNTLVIPKHAWNDILPEGKRTFRELKDLGLDVRIVSE